MAGCSVVHSAPNCDRMGLGEQSKVWQCTKLWQNGAAHSVVVWQNGAAWSRVKCSSVSGWGSGWQSKVWQRLTVEEWGAA